MTKKRTSQKPLTGRVALVAGATRGAGRGIARALAEAGATVYCTGGSVKGKPSPYGRPETIEETAAIIKAAGGSALALRVDHTRENEVKALFRRISAGTHRHAFQLLGTCTRLRIYRLRRSSSRLGAPQD
jgi:NAD(P)-dependent dehydrogenase (short-subunit alcohol dehydrogenase family)